MREPPKQRAELGDPPEGAVGGARVEAASSCVLLVAERIQVGEILRASAQSFELAKVGQRARTQRRSPASSSDYASRQHARELRVVREEQVHEHQIVAFDLQQAAGCGDEPFATAIGSERAS